MGIFRLADKYGLESIDNVETSKDVIVPEVDIEETLTEPSSVELTEEIDQDSEQIEAAADDIVEIDSARVAVEAYLDVLNQRESKGLGMSEDVSKLIRIGLESISPDFFQGVVISNEDALEGEIVDEDDFTADAKAKDVGPGAKTRNRLLQKLIELFQAGVKALARLVDLVRNYWNNMTANLDKLLERIKNTAKEASVLEGGHQMKVGGLNRLSVDGKFVGDDPQAYKDMIEVARIVYEDLGVEAAKDYAEWFKDTDKILKDLGGVSAGKKANTRTGELMQLFADSSSKAVDKLMRKADKLVKIDPKDRVPGAITRFPSNIDIHSAILKEALKRYNKELKNESTIIPARTKTIMGDTAYYVGIPDKNTVAVTGLFINHVFAPVKEDGSKSNRGNVVRTSRGTDALRTLGECRNVVEGIKNYRKAVEDMQSELDDIRRKNSEGRNISLRNISNSSTTEAQQANVINYFVRNHINTTLRMFSQTKIQFTGHLLSTVKASVALFEEMIKVESKEIADAK